MASMSVVSCRVVHGSVERIDPLEQKEVSL